VHRLSQLRRDPHLLGWFGLAVRTRSSLCNTTREKYLLCFRRGFHDLAVVQGRSLPCDLILPEDSPPLPQYLPRALSPEDDPLLQQELRRIDSLPTNALLLIRAESASENASTSLGMVFDR
jgi:hypothetical protein